MEDEVVLDARSARALEPSQIRPQSRVIPLSLMCPLPNLGKPTRHAGQPGMVSLLGSRSDSGAVDPVRVNYGRYLQAIGDRAAAVRYLDCHA